MIIKKRVWILLSELRNYLTTTRLRKQDSRTPNSSWNQGNGAIEGERNPKKISFNTYIIRRVNLKARMKAGAVVTMDTVWYMIHLVNMWSRCKQNIELWNKPFTQTIAIDTHYWYLFLMMKQRIAARTCLINSF